MESEQKENTWTSCCIKVDKSAVKFFSQLGIISSVMIFCIYQLINQDSCNSQTTYLSLLTTLIGILITSPRMQQYKILFKKGYAVTLG